MLTETLSRPRQVGHLEAGGVLLQYRDLDAAELDRLTALAGGRVVVAPNPLLPDRVVATAWLRKEICSAVDVSELESFVSSNLGHGPDDH